MLALGAHKSTGLYPTTSAPQQRWCPFLIWWFVMEWACVSLFLCSNSKQHAHTHKVTWIHTDNKAQVQTWKMGARKNKTSMFALPDSRAAPGFLMEKHISPFKPSRLRSSSVCGLSVINLFLTEARLYVRDFFFPSAGRMFFVLTTLAERHSLFA